MVPNPLRRGPNILQTNSIQAMRAPEDISPEMTPVTANPMVKIPATDTMLPETAETIAFTCPLL